ncbi:MAG TPA: amidohydrolase family protein, partial [Candidatus Nitrosocosmicus sp.]|nr:amidohydrolase family protein [Candidatus Nitrosocosmicus sp.]
VYEKVLKEMPLKDHRYRIEHFQIVTQEDIARVSKLGIIPSMQAVHATSDKNIAEDRIGADRMKGAYAWRTIIDAGSIVINGSDAPVELANPYHGIYAAVTRKDRNGNPEGGWYSGECMTREEAIKSFTIWSAYGQFEDKLKGSLEAGKLADFTVIDRDIMACPDSDIKDIATIMTVVGGKTVYSL